MSSLRVQRSGTQQSQSLWDYSSLLAMRNYSTGHDITYKSALGASIYAANFRLKSLIFAHSLLPYIQ